MNTQLMAVTVWQPWASLIMAGVKPHEFRGRPAPRSLQGRRIVIAAGARKVRPFEIRDLIMRLRDPEIAWTTGLQPEALPFLERWHTSPGSLPLASGLGTVLMGTSIIASAIPGNRDSLRTEHSNWGWPMSEIETFPHPVPAKGAQGFWPWKGEAP